MDMAFMVSVIIPVYNAEPYIRECIESILSQTYTNFELLLVDDGSPDDCGRICDEYAEQDIRIHVFHKENGGVSKARNLGLEYAKGNYICFIDSDDWVDVDMLETLIGWEQKKQTDLLFYGFKYESSTGCSDTINLLRQLSDIYEGADSIVEVCYLLEKHELFGWTWNKLFKNSIIQKEQIRFNEEISIQEDHIFTLEYLKYSTCIGIYPYTPYHYRIVQGSLTDKIHPYLMYKKKTLLLFQARMDWVATIEYADVSVHFYRQFATYIFLFELLYYYRISIHQIENKLEEIKFIREMIKRYALKGEMLKMYILYVMSCLPSFICYILLQSYAIVKRK